MPKRSTAVPPWMFYLDRASPAPYYRQLYEGLREAVLSGRLGPGACLPSTRELASELGLSRATAITAYRQLLAEGYLEGRVGSGTYVASELPDDLLRARLRREQAYDKSVRRVRALSRRGESLRAAPMTSLRDGGVPRAFQPWVPALDEFPWRVWSRLLAQRYRRPRQELLNYGPPAGHWVLRRAIAEHLGTSRAVRCEPEQVIVVSGSQQALDLTARVLLDPVDEAWVEDPGYAGTYGALVAAGASVVPVPVNREGLHVTLARDLCPDARLACVTPSHQYPLGITMSLRHRLALLEWAAREGAWVLENDYDSEYRYAGRPIAALQGLDTEGRVIYAGTFSKVLFPSLRLGYLVVPLDLVDAFVAARAFVDRGSSLMEQALLADFLIDGHFSSHVRRMRALYAGRQEALVEAARRELAGLLEVRPNDSGMHLVGWLPEGVDGDAASRRAAQYGVVVPSIASYSLLPSSPQGLVLGYAAVNEGQIAEGVRRLGHTLEAGA
jgi:GntR family transcriptional regulator / MocR family aminotransferase